MTKKRSIVLLIIYFIIISSCSNQDKETKKILQDFSKKTITIPTDLQVIKNREQTIIDTCTYRPTLIIYYDTLSCGERQVENLDKFIDIYKLSDTLKTFDIMPIFSPKIEDYDNLIEKIIIKNFEYPIYIDFTGSFREINKYIPTNKKFHIFLLDADKKPIFVGNPIISGDLWELFISVLNNMEHMKTWDKINRE